MQRLIKSASFSRSTLSLWVLAIIYLWVFFNFSSWKGSRVIVWDAYEYYLYLPSVFVHHNFNLDWAMPELHKIGDGFQWDFLSPAGKPVGRMSMGLAMLYAPFFLMGHAGAYLSGAETNGFSAPYYFFMLLGTIVLAMCANMLLRNVLKRWFTDEATAVTLLILNLGTNLFYFVTSVPLITHAANFFLFAAFLYLTIRWYRKYDVITSLLLGHVAAFIILVRPTNAVGLLLFPLWNLRHFYLFGERFSLFVKQGRQLFLMALSAVLVFLPQLIYWKMQTGQWYYYSYGFLGAFYFDTPHLWDGLFSYRKGWLLYTPVMLFSLAGFFVLHKYVKGLTGWLVFLLALHFYVVVSFWCWWYGAGFGLRPMVDIYPLLSIPLAAFIQEVMKQKMLKQMAVPVVLVLVFINQFQTYQTRKNVLHFDSVTGAYYWANFLRMNKAEETQHLLKAPDYFKAVKNEEVY